ncbi:hypothetical protein D3C87_1643410 [compost metagenome]
MWNVALLQSHHGGQDFGDARLVIGTEQRFTVGGDQRLPQHLVQDREHHWRQHFITNAQGNIAAAVIFDDLRVDVLTGKIR